MPRTRIHRWYVVALLLLAPAGCARVVVEGGMPRTPRTVAVLDFAEHEADTDSFDYVFLGRSGTRRPGPLASRIMRQSLARVPALSVMSQREMRDRSARSAEADGLGPQAVGRALGADCVIAGEVTAYRTAWFLCLQWATVSFSARCVDASEGKEIWSVRAKDTAFLEIEEGVAKALCDTAVERLQGPASHRRDHSDW